MNIIRNVKSKLSKAALSITLSIILTASVFANSQFAYAAVQNVKDLNQSSDFAQDAITQLVQENVITGDENGYFHPHNTVTRGEMVTVLVRALKIDVSSITGRSTFKDVPENHWANKYVEAAVERGIIKGISSDTFGVNNKCTREEMALMFMRSLGLKDSDINGKLQLDNISGMADVNTISGWSREAVEFSIATGLMKGTGGNNFSPRGNAEREQVAVVAYRYLSNKANISSVANTLIGAQNGVRLSFNGDAAILNVKPVVENGEVLVPASFFEAIGAQVDADKSEGTVKISREACPPDGDTRNVVFKAGETKAYIDYFSNNNPFDSSPVSAKKVTLNSAPKAVDSELLVPAQLVAETLGAEYTWNAETQTADIQDANTNKYPNLYNAFKNSTDYKGEFTSSISMVLEERNSNESLKMDMHIKGEVNGANSHITMNGTTSIPGEPAAEENSEVYIIGDTAYTWDDTNGEWVVSTADEAQQGSMPVPDYKEDNALFLDNYENLNLQKLGNVIVNGTAATKYTITLDAEDMARLTSESSGDGMIDLSQIYNNGCEMKVNIYLNDKGQIVRAAYKLTGGSKDENIDLVLNLVFDVNYTNIGKDIEIVAPV